MSPLQSGIWAFAGSETVVRALATIFINSPDYRLIFLSMYFFYLLPPWDFELQSRYCSSFFLEIFKCFFGQDFKAEILNVKFCQDFEAEFWSSFQGWILVKT